MKKGLRGQVSLEVITSYGWVLASVVIVLGVIAYLGVTDTSKFIDDRCWFGSQITCVDFSIQKLSDTETNVYALLRNEYLTSIEIVSVQSVDINYNLLGCNLPIMLRVKQNFPLECIIDSNVDISSKVSIPLKLTIKSNLTNTTTNITGEISGTVPNIGDFSKVIIECNDGFDNDFNGCTDYSGQDSGCISENDRTELGGTCPQAWSGGANLSCSVRDSGDCNETILFRISNRVDGHAELNNMSNFNYDVCCRSDSGVLSTSCVAPEAIPIRISNNTNAHAEMGNETNFPYNVCLSSSIYTVSCRFTTGTCSGVETCVATLSDSTDGHIGDCTTSPFYKRVCCEAS